MISNEQRAHDIAIAMLPYAVNIAMETSDSVNYVEEYLEMYSTVLRELCKSNSLPSEE